MSVRARVLLAATAAVGVAAAVFPWASRDALELAVHGTTATLVRPSALFLLAVVPWLGFVASISWVDVPGAQKVVGLLVRSLLVASLAVALAEPSVTEDATKSSVVFVVDVSDSIPDAALARAREIVERARRARGENDVRLVTFSRDARVIPLPEDDGTPLPAIARHGGESSAETDLANAIRLAYGVFRPGHLRRIVLVSDGIETLGDARAEASRARALGVRIEVQTVDEGVPAEVAVRALETTGQVRVGAPFEVRAKVFASRATSARIRLFQGSTLNGLDSVRRMELPSGETEVVFRTVVRVPGPVTYRVEVDPSGDDRFPQNNRSEATVVVPGRPAVLYAEGARSREGYLARALSAAELDVEVRTPRALPTTAAELERFDFVILSDAAADEVSMGQVQAIEQFVREQGGGFLMAGGDRAFGPGGWQGTAMERLLPVRMDAERRRDQPTLALCLVLDRSGSMAGQKIELAKEAAKAAASLLGPEDAIEVVVFDAAPERIVRMQSAGNRLGIVRDIGRIAARGGTNIFPALDMAYQDLSVTRARVKHVILLTDGQSPEEGIEELAQVMRAEGITLSTVGLGADVNRTLLSTIASLGAGRSYFTSDASNVPRIFVRETTTVARSSVVEEYFQPSVVAPADFLRGLDLRSAPFLHGYVATRAKPSPAQVVLASDLGEPILARWRVGLGWALAWTSDVKNRWAADWLTWPGYSQFWAQLVREHMRRDRTDHFPMTTELVGDRAHVVVDAIGSDDSFQNGLESSLEITRADGSAVPGLARAAIPLPQTAPGRYEAFFPLDAYGSFAVRAVHRRAGRPVAESTGELGHPFPGEYRTLEPDRALLGQLAAVTRGRVDRRVEDAFDARGESIRSFEPRWSRAVGLAVALFLLDIALRRVRFREAALRARGTAKPARV